MFCPNCGKRLEEEGAFCPFCGKPLAETPVQEVPVAPVQEVPVAPVQTAPVAEPMQEAVAQPVVGSVPEQNPDVPAEGSDAAPITPARRRKGLKKILAACGCLVLVALVLVAVFQWNWIKGTAIKTFGSDTDYFAYVQRNALLDGSGSFTQMYGDFLNAESEMSYESDLTVKAGPLLSALAPSLNLDLDGLSEVKMTSKISVDGEKSEYRIGLFCGEEELATVHVIFDGENEVIYCGLPGLVDSYVSLELPRVSSDDVEDAISVLLSDLEELAARLPSDEALQKLIEKYLDIILDNIDGVTSETRTITVEGVSQKVTVLTLEVDTDLLSKIFKAVLTEARNDTVICDIISKATDGLLTDDTDPVESYRTAIDDLLSQMKEAPSENKVLFTFSEYVGSDHSCVGFSTGDAVLLMPVDGDKFALSLEVSGREILAGSGTVKNDAYTGSFRMTDGESALITFDVEDLDLSRMEDGFAKGKMRVWLPVEVFGTENSCLEYVFDVTPDASSLKIALRIADTEMISVEDKGKRCESAPILLPETSVTVTDERGLQNWVAGLDLAELQRRFQAVGLDRILTEIMKKVA